MEHVRDTDVNSTAEVAKTSNRVIDNMNRIEGMVLELIPRPKSKKKGGKK